ncbi:S8 family peptidase [Paenibacillus sp. Leaf72]|uniref:S8 family peptidase n=1 Tax=Paenibacillus sp. Leaf72 TaxID=1736234 RepID=UPI0007008916|nr:S8 family peptidase [Paenibacillus sp. Leaf72]KQO17466.1 hypothetical protein ASF12_01910 [Paenibacillus sp. Leaf72]
MPRLDNLIASCSAYKPSKHTERQLISFTTHSSYKRCLRLLESRGIHPFKTMPGCKMIGFLLDRRSSWKHIIRHPEVKLMERDVKIRKHDTAPQMATRTIKPNLPIIKTTVDANKVPWNIKRVQAPLAWKRTLGRPVKLAIIDTGIAKHPDLRISGGVNTMGGTSYYDDNGHGTHVAGIAAGRGLTGLYGVAPNIKLYAVKALDLYGSGYVSDIVDAIEWCIRNKMNVINMSFGIVSGQHSDLLRQAIKRAAKQGIVITASAGNEGPNTTTIDEPASFPETIAVAATNRLNQIADYSNRGMGIDVAAPGTEIISTWLNGKYAIMSGTSMSSPHVAGGAALLLSVRPKLSSARVSTVLRKWSVPLKGYLPTAQGSGLLRLGRIRNVSS